MRKVLQFSLPVLLAIAFIVVPVSTGSAQTVGDLAVGFGEASQQPGSWTASTGYSLAVNWDGSTGSRPVAVATSAVPAGTTVTGPTLTNALSQSASGGSLVILRGDTLAVRGTTAAHHVSGVNGGSSATIARPTGMLAGDLVAVYINTSNTMVAPAGWTQQHKDGQGTVWTQAFTTAPADLGAWTTAGGGGWTYTAVAFSAASGSPSVVATGGGGAQTNRVVSTGSATSPALAAPTPTPTPVPLAPTPTPTPVPLAPTPTPVPTTTGFSATDPMGEDRCHNTALLGVNVVTDYGARGDGVTDNKLAFSSAIATGKVVHVPAGTFVLSQVDLSAGATAVLCGAGQGTTTLLLAPSASTEAMFSQFDYTNAGHLGYLEIQNMTLDGNTANVPRRAQGSTQNNYGLVHVMVTKALIANDEIRNAYHGLRILDVGDQAGGVPGELVVRDNWFHGMALEAGWTGGTTHNIYVAKHWPSSSVVWIDRNTIEECGSGTGATCTLPSTTPGQSAGGLLYSPDGPTPPQQMFRIKDNTFRNLGMNMVGTDEPEGEIYLYQQADGAQIIGNQFINSYYEGVAVFSSNNVEIAHNTVDGNGVPVDPASGYSHMEYYAIGAFSRRTNFPTYVNSSGWNLHDNTVKNSHWYKIGVCACFATDAAGNGTGSNITIATNTFVNNLNQFNGTSHTTPIDSATGTANVTLTGNDATLN